MDISTIALVTATLGAIAGVTGAVLGIINTWTNIKRDRVRLRVRLVEAITLDPIHGPERRIVIEVLNLSEFPVVITDCGVNLTNGDTASFAPVLGMEPRGPLPITLESRTKYQKLFPRTDLDDLWARIGSSYAQTECGVTAKGKIAVSPDRRRPIQTSA